MNLIIRKKRVESKSGKEYLVLEIVWFGGSQLIWGIDKDIMETLPETIYPIRTYSVLMG